MAKSITWTRTASKDLDDAAEYIARDSRFYAATMVREAKEASRSLKRFAERGRIVPEFNEPTIRELLVRQYRLLYKIEGKDKVYIIGFVHGARDLSKLWEREARQLN